MLDDVLHDPPFERRRAPLSIQWALFAWPAPLRVLTASSPHLLLAITGFKGTTLDVFALSLIISLSHGAFRLLLSFGKSRGTKSSSPALRPPPPFLPAAETTSSILHMTFQSRKRSSGFMEVSFEIKQRQDGTPIVRTLRQHTPHTEQSLHNYSEPPNLLIDSIISQSNTRLARLAAIQDHLLRNLQTRWRWPRRHRKMTDMYSVRPSS